MNKKFEEFLNIWVVVLLLNQIFIFGACFYPACIVAALPHTGVISFFVWKFSNKKKKEDKYQNDIVNQQEKKSENLFDKQEKERKDKEFEELLNNILYQKEENSKNTIEELLKENSEISKNDPLKAKGDKFEKYIGKKFEDKGELVIYNGFIKGYKDKGVDVISLCSQTKSINLVQCKNWTRKSMFLEDIENIHTKLSEYDFDFCTLSSRRINQYLQMKKDNNSIQTMLRKISENLEEYTIRKTLYVSSDKVMDLRIGEKLTMMKANIYKYEDMKIVVHGIG